MPPSVVSQGARGVDGRSFAILTATVATAALVGSVAFALAGPVVTTDSAGYLSVAGNLAEGRGLVTTGALPTERSRPEWQLDTGGDVPFSEQPPLYPVAMSALVRTGVGEADAALVVNVVATVALAVLVLLAARDLLPRAPPVVLGAVAVLIMAGPAVTSFLVRGSTLAMTALVLSEPLFTTLLFAALLVGSRGVATARPSWVGGAVGLVAAATLTRYLGAVAGVACAAAVLGPTATPLRHRGAAAAVVAVSGPLALLVYSTANGLVNDAPAAKGLAWHPTARGGDLARVVAGWFGVPWSAPLAVAVVVVVALVLVPVVLAFVAPPPASSERGTALLRTLAAAVLVYPTALLVSQAVIDQSLPMDERLLGPVRPAVYLVLAAATLGRLLVGERRRDLAVTLAACLVVAALVVGPEGNLRDSHELTTALSEAQQRRIDARPFAALEGTGPVFSNDPTTLSLYGGRSAFVTPFEAVVTTGESNPTYRADVEVVVAAVGDTGLVVALPSSPGVAAEDYEEAGLTVLAACDDGTILLGRASTGPQAAATRLCANLAEEPVPPDDR